MPDTLRRFRSLFLWLAIAPAAAAQGNLELGKMWTFESPPLDYLRDEYGFEPPAGWLDALRMASLRFGDGCSASFVSPRGLIMTNHHCARGQIAEISPEDQDWVRNGFYASSLEDEVRIPGLTVQQLVQMRDVTAAMNAGIAGGDDDASIAAARDRNEAGLLAQAREQYPELQPEVVELHQGAVYQLYLYRVWDDVRLVCAPHLQIAHFGGDPDNFTFPRYSLDFSFLRAWVDGKPAATEAHYFEWSKSGPAEGDLVFVTGNPGSTDRLKTKAQMNHLRDAGYPMIRQLIDNRLGLMKEIAKLGPEQEKQFRTQILTFENAQKAYAGYHSGLLNEPLMARKIRAEAAFKRAVLADPDLRERYAHLWARLEETAAAKTAFEPQRRFHTPGGSKHLARALELVRAATATDPERRQEYLKGAMAVALEASPYDRASFIDHLARARDWLPPSDPFRRYVIGDRTPEQTAALLESSQVGDPEFESRLVAAGEEAIKLSDDPAVRMAVVLEPLIRAKDATSARLSEQESTLGAELGRAMFAVYGARVSPDATFTLRFSDGVVMGYPYNGTIAPWRTSFYGLFGRHAEFEGEHPFDLPKPWLERQDQIDLRKSVCFVSSNDIIGGNSGSPIVSRNLEIVGLIFDGNIEMLANRFVYSDDVPRAVSVHSEAIIEALAKIYNADRVLEELLGQ
ncbi:MAG: S46 family peptidase [Planctomycetota bacterium]